MLKHIIHVKRWRTDLLCWFVSYLIQSVVNNRVWWICEILDIGLYGKIVFGLEVSLNLFQIFINKDSKKKKKKQIDWKKNIHIIKGEDFWNYEQECCSILFRVFSLSLSLNKIK